MSLRLVHLSDIHFGREDRLAVEAALALTHDLAPSLTVVTGDLTLAGRRAEFIAARAWLDRLPQPVMATPGNHDMPYYNLFLRSVSPFERWRRYIGVDDAAVFENAELSATAINTARGAQARANWSHGVISLAAIDQAAARMATAGDRLRVFACHHPLVDAAEAAVSGGVRRGREALKVLTEACVDLVLTGHVHHAFAVPLPFGDGLSYICGAGTLSLRQRGEPASFSVIDADADTLTVTAHDWTGERFESSNAWTWPRRAGTPLPPFGRTPP
jgi:3',5'-cyclic AMP phosphodiesterase CpdA